MIARDSKSYPYLAIAQHYNVPYGEVLNFAEELNNCEIESFVDTEWKQAVYDLYCSTI